MLQMQQGTTLVQQLLTSQKAYCVAELHSREMLMQVSTSFNCMVLIVSACCEKQELVVLSVCLTDSSHLKCVAAELAGPVSAYPLRDIGCSHQ